MSIGAIVSRRSQRGNAAGQVADPTLPDTSGISLREKAFSTLKQRIIEGTIAPGTVLSESRAAEDLGISRTPVREALVRLTHEGLAQRFPGRGVIVLELSVKEALDVIDVQACLEQFAIARVFEDGRGLDAAELHRLLEIQRRAVAAGDRRRFLEHDRKMHLAIIRAADNSKLTTVMENASDLMMYGGHRALQSEARMQETFREHETLVHALVSGGLGAALAASKAHIQSAKRRLLG